MPSKFPSSSFSTVPSDCAIVSVSFVCPVGPIPLPTPTEKTGPTETERALLQGVLDPEGGLICFREECRLKQQNGPLQRRLRHMASAAGEISLSDGFRFLVVSASVRGVGQGNWRCLGCKRRKVTEPRVQSMRGRCVETRGDKNFTMKACRCQGSAHRVTLAWKRLVKCRQRTG